MFTLGPENSNHEYLRSAVNRHVIQKYDVHKRFNIHGILRDCISEYMLIKDLPCELINQSVLIHLKLKLDHDVMCVTQKQMDFYNNIFQRLYNCTSNTYIVFFSIAVVRGRFCRIFSEILQELENKSFTSDYQRALCQLNMEQQNFNKLLTDVLHCTSDTYHIFVNIASFQFNLTTPAFLFNSPDSYGR